MGQLLGCVIGPIFCLVVSPIDFFLSSSSISQKVTWQKVWVRLTFGRSLEVKNMQKQENLLRGVKTK
jgi:hypothetical protein